MKTFQILLGMLSLVLAFHAKADGIHDGVISPVISHKYIVSGLLKLNKEKDTVKLTQAVEFASNKEVALVLFKQLMQEHFPDYTLISFLITEDLSGNAPAQEIQEPSSSERFNI